MEFKMGSDWIQVNPILDERGQMCCVFFYIAQKPLGLGLFVTFYFNITHPFQ